MLSIERLQATCTNINLRRENEGDDHVTAVDIKISANAPAEIANQLTGTKSSGVFWTNKGEPTYPGIAGVDLRAEFENHNVTLDGVHLTDCKLNKFEFEPMIGSTMALEFRIQARPDGEQLSALTELIKEDFELAVAGPPELDLGSPDER